MERSVFSVNQRWMYVPLTKLSIFFFNLRFVAYNSCAISALEPPTSGYLYILYIPSFVIFNKTLNQRFPNFFFSQTCFGRPAKSKFSLKIQEIRKELTVQKHIFTLIVYF